MTQWWPLRGSASSGPVTDPDTEPSGEPDHSGDGWSGVSADEQVEGADLDGDGSTSPNSSEGLQTEAPEQAEPDVTGLEEQPGAVVIAIANQKGGVGKTTTAVSLSAAIAQSGARVILVDLDPQANASSGLSRRAGADQATTYHALADEIDPAAALVDTDVPNLRLLPSSIDLAGAEVELVSAFSREQRLRRILAALRSDADLVIVDCPPSLGLLTVNALTAADGVLVPIQCEYYALEGLEALRRNVELVRDNLNPDLHILGFVLTMLDGRTRLSHQVVEEVRLHFGDKVFNTRIPRTVRLAEAPGFGQPITTFDPGSRGAVAYRRLASEVLARLQAARPAG